jgi:predicted CxxxxCH...CXXCH cytochrome family protein
MTGKNTAGSMILSIYHDFNTKVNLLILTIFIVLLSSGCTDDSLSDGTPYDAISADTDTSILCSICHGSNNNAAPPVSIAGESSTSNIAVGAHQSHLNAGAFRSALHCSNCHTVPETVDQAGHINGSVDITWSRLASSGGLDPVWVRDNATCSSTYCHGSSLEGGTNNTPVWTTVDGSQVSCGSCHSIPPPEPHINISSCYYCHEESVTVADTINLSSSTHIDGTVQASDKSHPENWDEPAEHSYSFYDNPLDCKICHGNDYNGGISGISCDDCHTDETSSWRTLCTFCHGGSDNQTGAPPFGVHEETETSLAVVGAHTKHVQESASHTGWDCNVCHTKPSAFDDAGHIDGISGAEVIFSSIAGDTAQYDRSNASCSAVYCHGNGINNSGAILWTSAAAMNCDSCHAYYSNSGSLSGRHEIHIKDEGYQCSECHKEVIDSADSIIDKSLHINRMPDISLSSGTYNSVSHSCNNTSCHEEEEWFD